MRLMKPVKQEDVLGCAVACVAFVSGISYQEALALFEDGETRVKRKANFYCPEIVRILNNRGANYKWKRLQSVQEKEIYSDLSIVFIERSRKYPYGHFLAKYKDRWMDPWINLPDKNINAGFRKILPNTPSYIIYQG